MDHEIQEVQLLMNRCLKDLLERYHLMKRELDLRQSRKLPTCKPQTLKTMKTKRNRKRKRAEIKHNQMLHISNHQIQNHNEDTRNDFIS